MFGLISKQARQAFRSSPTFAVACTLVIVLSLKTFFGILYEYQWYFPPDYDHSAFLSGRRRTFVGIYQPAFYVHIISGPITMLLGTYSLLTGGVKKSRKLHGWVGRANVFLVLALVVPSGFLMTLQAYGGPSAMLGFAALTSATGISAVMATLHARRRRFRLHRVWAIRLYILLISPLVLRIFAGVMIVTGLESVWTYRINAWGSWLAPLAIYEAIDWRAEFASSVD
ncbi:MAG: DUF2306 domain-containing protein [Rubripirellula sp.]